MIMHSGAGLKIIFSKYRAFDSKIQSILFLNTFVFQQSYDHAITAF